MDMSTFSVLQAVCLYLRGSPPRLVPTLGHLQARSQRWTSEISRWRSGLSKAEPLESLYLVFLRNISSTFEDIDKKPRQS